MSGPRVQTVDRFWSLVDKSGGPDSCWPWRGSIGHFGYGDFRRPGWRVAHRFSYYVANGTIPVGLNVLHRCDNPPCVNPAHLFVGSLADNNADRNAKGRQARGSRLPQTVLTAEQVIEIRALDGQQTYVALARTYGVSASQIARIQQRTKWMWLS